MPLYSVRMMPPMPTRIDWWLQVYQLRAKSPGAATQHLERVHTGWKAVNVRLLADVDRNYWRKIWKRAYDNMPTMVRVIRGQMWMPQEPGTTHLPKFIKGEAKGTMRITDGIVEKLKTKLQTHRKSKEACLAELLQYCKADRRSHNLRSQAVLRGMALGVVPRSKTKQFGSRDHFDRRDMLLKLASSEGAEIARKAYENRFSR